VTIDNKPIPPILAHPQDIHCVFFHALVIACYATAFYIFLHPEIAELHTIADKTAFVITSALMLGWISGIDTGVNFHNHVHKEIFRNKNLNLWFGRFWAVVGGWPALYWKHSHTTIHHRNILESADWTLPRRKENGELESLFVYSLALWPWRSLPHMWRNFTDGHMSQTHRENFIKESLIFLAVWSVPFIIDPIMGLALWLLPQFIANICVMGPGMYAQHYGCDAASADKPFTHSNTFVSRFFNLTMFNIGYHIEHHQWANIHWSELPKVHRQKKNIIIQGGGHIVPFGYYRGGQLLSAWFNQESGKQEFLAQHPDYLYGVTQE
jgi:fatty acid desaturase